MCNHKRITYQYRLFFAACLCIWLVVGGVAYFEYQNKKQHLTDLITNRVSFSVGNIFMTYDRGRDIRPFMDFMEDAFVNTEFQDLSIRVYDAKTGELIDASGPERTVMPTQFEHEVQYETLYDGSRAQRINYVTLPNGEKMFYCGRRVSANGRLLATAHLPLNENIEQRLAVPLPFWLIIIGAGLCGTVLVFIMAAHQAKNVKLLNDFAKRAAEDRNFIPKDDDFPTDEIGEISRQIVSIYNSRMQANQRREQEHIIALKATEEKNQSKRLLTDNISHELKTPIGIIRAYIDTLIGQPDMSHDDQMRFFAKIKQNVERLVSMTTNLSTMTRLEESGETIPMKSIDFRRMVETFVEDTVSSGILGDIEFTCNLPEQCNVVGNEGLLHSVLSNLVKNSIAYSQGSHIGIEHVSSDGQNHTFVFYDDGVGVDAAHLPHLFDRFYRVDAGRSRKAGGTGLGLAIVQSSVVTMGGTIEVDNRSEGGLQFTITLPKASEPIA